MCTCVIFSGECSAISSISMPPAAEAMMTGDLAAPSTVTLR